MTTETAKASMVESEATESTTESSVVWFKTPKSFMMEAKSTESAVVWFKTSKPFMMETKSAESTAEWFMMESKTTAKSAKSAEATE